MLVRLVKLDSHAIFTHKQAILTHKVVALNKEDNIFPIYGVRAGYEAYLLFVVQTTGVREVRPNDRTHLVFGETLRQAKAAGVGIMAIGCRVYDSGEVVPDTPIPVIL